MTQAVLETLYFGAFTLDRRRRVLLCHGERLFIGSRAFDILSLLASRPNEVVAKGEIIASVWPGITVEEVSLRFHITNLRKLLSGASDDDGQRFITTVIGRGYCFVAPLESVSDRAALPVTPGSTRAAQPTKLDSVVGRSEECANVVGLLKSARCVTISGPGGVGKTTLANIVAERSQGSFGEVYVVDLGSVVDGKLVESTILATIRAQASAELGGPLTLALAAERCMLVLDTCEHVIDEVAVVVAAITATAPNVRLLCTSREPLNIDGEVVCKLSPLACAPQDARDLSSLREYPAIELFLRRAGASGTNPILTSKDMLVVGEICRKLDGLPLAIELAAARVASYGLHKTLELLDDEMPFSWQGQRTAPSRQKSLGAAIEWSYRLLSDNEREILRVCSVFAGFFTFGALRAVAPQTLEDRSLLEALDGLVTKSLLVATALRKTMRYRLLDTTKAYVTRLAVEHEEAQLLSRRHADYYLAWLQGKGLLWPSIFDDEQRDANFAGLSNVRAALRWAFENKTRPDLAVGLATAAAPMFLSFTLIEECKSWMAQALELIESLGGTPLSEMHLQSALGVALMFMRTDLDASRRALERSVEVADRYGGPEHRLYLRSPLTMYHISVGEFREALEIGRHAVTIAESMDDVTALAQAYCGLGDLIHFTGDMRAAREQFDRLPSIGNGRQAADKIFRFEQVKRGQVMLARTMWLQGDPKGASDVARESIIGVQRTNHPLSISIASMWAASVYLWNGDFAAAENCVDIITECAVSYSLPAHLAVAQGFRGSLMLLDGDVSGGVDFLNRAIQECDRLRHRLQQTPLMITLAEGLLRQGRPDEALVVITDTLQLINVQGDEVYLPETLRIKGKALRFLNREAEEVNECLRRSLHLSQLQGSVAWELRTAIDIAANYAERGQREGASELIRNVVAKFESGGSADLDLASAWLSKLSAD